MLMIDDDASLAGMLREYLAPLGVALTVAPTGTAGLAALRRGGFDALVLDLMLPDADGLQLCRRIRAESELPILMLTARGDEEDRIVGLELGADDYLPKPFNPRELLARLRALLRRRGAAAQGSQPRLRFGRLEIDRDARVARVDGEERPLTAYQFDLLCTLAESAGRVLSRESLLDRVRGPAPEAYDRSIDVHISRIRSAIEDDPKRPRRILTIRGTGYVFAREQDGQATG
ncbi:MAG TPA: response regulator transcription factor [Vicinamibacteria bacterium]